MEDDEISMSIDSNNQIGASENTTTLQSDNNVDNLSTSNIDNESKTENVDDSLPPTTSNLNVVIDPLSQDLDKPLRQVRSHPSLGGRSAIPPGSLGSLAMTRSLKNNFNKTGITVAAAAQQPAAVLSQTSIKSHKVSQESLGRQKSPHDEKQNRQGSPGGGAGSSGPVNEEDEEEDGNHDTITSLAGAKMMQWYHKALTGSRKSSNVSLNQHRLEDLFLIEEDVKHEDEKEEDSDECAAEALVAAQALIAHPQDDEEFLEETDIFVPPDGGYGWFVALGAFIALMWTAGTVKSYGVIFQSILVQFPDASVSLASWIPASLTTLALAMAPIASALCSRYNCRNVTFAGSILCALGIGLSGFAPSIEYLFLTFGLLTGVGVGLSTTPGVILVARYFNKRRGIANAFCLSGTATGSFFIPFLIEYLLKEYGFQGTLFILGGCMLHLCISGALYRPLHVHVIVTRNERKRKEKEAEKEKEVATAAATATAEVTQPSKPSIVAHPSEPQLHYNYSHPHFGHHHHHQYHHLQPHHPLHRLPSDPNEVVSRLQSRLNMMASADTVSLCSDRDGGSHPFQSSSEFHSPPFTPQINGHQHAHPHQRLSYQVSTQPSSSFASHEDLQCNWSESRQSINDGATSRDSRPGDGGSGDAGPLMNNPCPESYCQSYLDIPVTSKAKALSLRELYIHQLGSRINCYTASLFGEHSSVAMLSRKRSAPPRHHVDSQPSFRAVDSFVSVKSALTVPQNRHYMTTHDSIEEEKSEKIRRKSSFMFSFEDLMTDSTCALKDTRYPKVRMRRQSGEDKSQTSGHNEAQELESARIVALGRSVSVASRRGRCEQARRNRYISEGQCSSDLGSLFDLSTAKCKTPPPSRVASFCSTYSGVRRRNESVISRVPSSAVPLEEVQPKKNDNFIDEKEEDNYLDDDVMSMSVSQNHPIVSCWNKFSRMLGLSLCTDPRFTIVVISVMSMSVGVPHVLFFLPSYLHSLKLDVDAATLLAVISVFDLLGRVCFGFLADTNFVPKFVMYSSLIFLSSVSIILLPLFNDAVSIFVMLSCYGLGVGGWFLMVPVLLADFFGVERIGASYGLARLFQSTSNLLGPILAGLIRDQTGSFKEAYFFMGAVMFLGFPVVLMTPLAEKKFEKSEKEESEKFVK